MSEIELNHDLREFIACFCICIVSCFWGCREWSWRNSGLFISDISSINRFIWQVDGLCALLRQNCETLKSVELIHCKLSATFINDICASLLFEDLKKHGIQHFSIELSSFLESSCFPLRVGLASFLSLGRLAVFLSLSVFSFHLLFYHSNYFGRSICLVYLVIFLMLYMLE